MKIDVITRHSVPNYGSLLQTMATQRVIENMGHTCEIINYIRPDESYWQQEKTMLRNKPNWNKSIILRTIYLLSRQPTCVIAGRKFERYQRKHLNLSKKYQSGNELVEDTPFGDVYLTGSDQVWGPVADGTYDSAYCLSFTKPADKRIAYAASFGRTDMTPEIKAYFKKWLGRYKYIAVREDSAVSILRDLGLKAVQVLDPTLLLDSDYWSHFTKPITKKYILVYQLHNDKRLGAYAKRVAQELQLPMIRVSASFHQISRPGKLVWCPTIGEFLSYIKNAECMITDSFHGTAFAINFNTPFVEVLPNNNTGTRNMSILQMTGLTERILRNREDVDLAKKPIDFSKANQIIAEKRKESLEVLRYMIEQ